MGNTGCVNSRALTKDPEKIGCQRCPTGEKADFGHDFADEHHSDGDGGEPGKRRNGFSAAAHLLEPKCGLEDGVNLRRAFLAPRTNAGDEESLAISEQV
jgi:hypothetical protein